MSTLGPDDLTPPRGILVGGHDAATAHPRAADAVQRAARRSSEQALGHAGQLAIVVATAVPGVLDPEQVDAIERALVEPVIQIAAAGRRPLIGTLERLERTVDAARGQLRTAAQYERVRQRHVALRRRLAELAERYPEVREALEQDR